jgi:hypothetical protein
VLGDRRVDVGGFQAAERQGAEEGEEPQVLARTGWRTATGMGSRNTIGLERIRSRTQRCAPGGTPGNASSRMRMAYSQTAASTRPVAAILAA